MAYIDELKQNMTSLLEQTGIYKMLGVKLVDLSTEQCVLSMTPKANFANLHGIMHGGIISVILDSSIMFSILANLPPGSNVIGVEIEVKFFNPAKLEYKELRAVGHPIEIKRTLGMGQSILYNEENVKIAFASAIAKIMLP